MFKIFEQKPIQTNGTFWNSVSLDTTVFSIKSMELLSQSHRSVYLSISQNSMSLWNHRKQRKNRNEDEEMERRCRPRCSLCFFPSRSFIQHFSRPTSSRPLFIRHFILNASFNMLHHFQNPMAPCLRAIFIHSSWYILYTGSNSNIPAVNDHTLDVFLEIDF